MKKQYKNSSLFLVVILCSLQNVVAQNILWEKTLGGKQSEYLFDAIATPDYGFILAGSSISSDDGTKTDSSRGNYDYWLWKMNEKGVLEWQKSFGGSGFDYLQSIQLTADGGFLLGGISNSGKGFDKKEEVKGDFDFWIIKLDAMGNEIWQRTIGGKEAEKLHSICSTSDGGYIIGGTSSSNITPLDEKGVADTFGKTEACKGNMDLWIVKLDSKGTILWQKTYGGEYVDELKAINKTADGGCIVGSYSNSPKCSNKSSDPEGEGDFWILKLSHKGEMEWEKTIGGDKDDNLFDIIPTSDGGYMVGGNSNSARGSYKTRANGKGTDFWILKLEEDGTIQWQETYDYGKRDILTSIIENPDHTFMIGGYAQSESNEKSGISGSDKEGINDYIGLKIDAKGETLWSKTVGSKGDEVLRKLFETRDGGFVMVGTSSGGASRDKASAQGENDFWVVKLKDLQKPEKEKNVLEVVPNPAVNFVNVLLNFEYTQGTVTLYDLAGRTLKAEKVTGRRTVPIELAGLPIGIYIVGIETDTKNESIKLIKEK